MKIPAPMIRPITPIIVAKRPRCPREPFALRYRRIAEETLLAKEKQSSRN